MMLKFKAVGIFCSIPISSSLKENLTHCDFCSPFWVHFAFMIYLHVLSNLYKCQNDYIIILVPCVHLCVPGLHDLKLLFWDISFYILAPFISILTKFIPCRILAITGSLLMSLGFLCAAFTSSVPVLFLCLGILPGKQQKYSLHIVPKFLIPHDFWFSFGALHY